jgi:cell wall-associated NlpC family hydrolase
MPRAKALAALSAASFIFLAGCVVQPEDPIVGSVNGVSASMVNCGTGTVEGLGPEQMANAKIIAEVAMGLGLGQQGALVGIVTALTESTLNNVNYGDIMASGQMSSSRGLFQQLNAWGPLEDRIDPAKAAMMFYTGGAAGQEGLIDIPGWQTMSVPAAAQAVEKSQFTDGSNYAKQMELGTAVTQVVTANCTEVAASTSNGTVGGAIVSAAQKYLGTPYVWGGGTLTGPSGVDEVDGRGPGFDCSGLTRYAVYTATGGEVEVQRTADAQGRTAGVAVPADLALMQPGDLIAFDSGDRVANGGYDHIAIYMGNGQIIHAPQSTENVQLGQVGQVNTGFYADRSKWSVRRIVLPGSTTGV